MTIVTNWYTMDNKLGINLNAVMTSVNVSASASGDGIAFPQIGVIPKLGDRVQGNNGSEWVFVVAGTTVSAFNIIAISPLFSAQSLTKALIVSNAYSYGIAEFQPVGGASVGAASAGVANAGDFFWALVKANSGIRINATATLDPGADLYCQGTGTAGFVAGSSSIVSIAGGGRLNGLMFLGSVSIDGSSNVPGNVNAEFGMFGYLMPAAQVAAVTV